MYDLRESAVLEYIESRPYSKGACTRTAPRQAAFTVLGTCDVLVALGIALGRPAPLRIREGTQKPPTLCPAITLVTATYIGRTAASA